MEQPPYRLGDHGPAVAQIRDHLARLGLLSGEPTDRLDADALDAPFDDVVDAAIRAFQQQRGLMADGVVGPQTWRRLDDARWRLGDRVLRYAVSHPLSGDDVAALQRRLHELGFDPGQVDAIFGPDTERALRELQRNVGIPVDGLCGPVTFKALERLARTVTGGASHNLRETERMHRAGPGLAGKVVVIDPGHGGSDPGAEAHGLSEALLMEDLAARIEGRLAATGVTAYLTRGRLGPDDTPPTEAGRADFANTVGADLLISLHVDRHANPAACGVASFYYGSGPQGGYSPVGRACAELVQAEIVGRTDLLDVHSHGKAWELLRRTRMPAVRVDIGYLTHPGDAARLAQPEFRDTLAGAVLVALQRLYIPTEIDAREPVRLPEPVA